MLLEVLKFRGPDTAGRYT